jgi:hypothetical protein
MSLTSYRAAPPRANIWGAFTPKQKRRCEIVSTAAFSTLRMGASHRQQSLATTYSSIA